MNNGNQPLISIITATFNRADFLEKNILSIKNQDYKNIEHIVVDGGSTDNTIEILNKYRDIYNLRWVSEKDKGCTNAINKGFKMATGDVICWLDSDDYYLPGTLSKIVKIFQEKPDIDVVFGDILIGDSSGKIVNYVRHTKFDPEILIYEKRQDISPQAAFWKKAVQAKIDSMNERYTRCADYDFFIRMGMSGAKFYHLRDFLGVYRWHPGQFTKEKEICKQERETISRNYIDKNLNKNQTRSKKLKFFRKRTANLIKQGDFWFVFRGFLRRLGVIKNPSLE